jgi:hypothetical protein
MVPLWNASFMKRGPLGAQKPKYIDLGLSGVYLSDLTGNEHQYQFLQNIENKYVLVLASSEKKIYKRLSEMGKNVHGSSLGNKKGSRSRSLRHIANS